MQASSDTNGAVEALIRLAGQRVREVRSEAGLSRRELSERSGVSARYLAQLESGEGNISIGLLQRVALALGTPIGAFLGAGPLDPDTAAMVALFQATDDDTRARVMQLLDPAERREQKAERICLTGLRGAGKSTLGALLARDLDLPFVELKREVEAASGMPASEIIDLYGQDGYRQQEAAALTRVIDSYDRVVLAVAGGIVSEAETYGTVLARFHTVWVQAAPQEHMDRVRAQGDLRPMEGNPQAMAQLRAILTSRAALYRRADMALDTSGRSVDQSRAELRALISRYRILVTA